MNSSPSGPDPRWWTEFEGIVFPQWAPALVWRAFMRVLPYLFSQTMPLSHDGEPALTEAFRSLMAYPFVLDLAYRKQRTNTPADPRQTAVAKQFFEQAGQLGSLAPAAAKAPSQLLSRMAAMLRQGGDAPPTLAQSAMEALVLALPQPLRPSWDESLQVDMQALYPLEVEQVEDLKEFMGSPLWQGALGGRPSGLSMLHDATPPLRAIETSALLEQYESHMTLPLAWDAVLDLLSRPQEPALLPAQAIQIEAIAADPARLATLLARMALDDRTRLDLAAAPSVAGFREALDHSHLRRAELPALEQRLASAQGGFVPNPTWLAWVQTVHRPGLKDIEVELRSWLPAAQAAASPDANAEPPQNAEPAAPAKPSSSNARPSRPRTRSKKGSGDAENQS